MDKEQFYQLTEDVASWNVSDTEMLKAVLEEYPYFQSARLLYTKSLHTLSHKNYPAELSKTAVFCADRKQLYYYIHHDEYAQFLVQQTEESAEEDRTMALLDSFLTSIEDTMEIEGQIITDPTLNVISTDYLSYLESIGDISPESTEEGNTLKHQDIIDSFIEKSENETLFTPTSNSSLSTTENTDKEETKDEFLTETLARIYIKQKKYEQALTIIKRLSLNFPKKSVYFADQIRFLEHLILNEKYKNK